jgi:hypothetical protein
MAATAKKPSPKPRTAALRLVPPASAIQVADKAIAAAARAPAPMVSRVATVRNEIQAKANDLSREREEYEERKTLLQQQYEAAIKGLDENIADIENALMLLNDGISAKQAAE